MNKALRSVFLISISAFLLLELGFFLEGFLQFILFSIATIILFVMLFLFYGYVRESKKKKSSRIGLFVAMLILPLLSIAFNPTLYFSKVSESQIALLAWQHPNKVLENHSSSSIKLLRNGTYRIKKFGFWMNTIEKGTYEVNYPYIHLKEGSFIKTLRVKRFYKVKKLYVINKGKLDFKENFLIEDMDKEFLKGLSKKNVIK